MVMTTFSFLCDGAVGSRRSHCVGIVWEQPIRACWEARRDFKIQNAWLITNKCRDQRQARKFIKPAFSS
jgi:hypothetical protein